MVAAIAVAVSAVAFLAAGCGSEELVVPKVTSVDSDVFEVYERLSDAGFTVEVTDGFRTGTSCRCENPIVEQWPPAGTRAKRGSVVEITVGGPGPTGSGGSGWLVPLDDGSLYLRLPSFVGLRLDAVDRWLSQHKIGWSADLAALPATKGDDLLHGYVVNAQDPGEESQFRSWHSVRLEAGPAEDVLKQWHEPTVVVPHVSGDRGILNAYDRLHTRGLRVTTGQRLANGPFMPVLAQEPKPGTRVRRGTTVRLILDTKPHRWTVCCDERKLTMPDFVGRNLGEVSEWLDRRFLYWRIVDAPPLPPTNSAHMLDPYVITSQKPAPGAPIPESSPSGSGDDLAPILLRAKLAAR